jgi:hypothetical protein
VGHFAGFKVGRKKAWQWDANSDLIGSKAIFVEQPTDRSYTTVIGIFLFFYNILLVY